MRLKSSLRFALPLALLFGTTALSTSVLPTTAHADYDEVGSWTGQDGTTFTLWQDDSLGPDGYAVVIEKGSTVTVSFDQWLGNAVLQKPGFQFGGDPGPDDTETGGEPPNIIALLENAKGLVIKVHVYPDQTPLAQWLDANGGGIVPVWNPGDDNGNGPPSPNKPNSGPTPAQLAAQAKLTALAIQEIDNIAGSMADIDGVASENAPGVSGRGNQGNSAGAGTGGGKSSSSSSNGIRVIFKNSDDVSQGPHPELVNPQPYSVMSPGLLGGGNNALTGNGPASTGGPISRGGPSGAGVSNFR